MSRHAKLIVAVDQVGALRSTRSGNEPDPVHFALQAELAGARGIRAHLRIDRAYLTEQDMDQLNRSSKTSFYLQISPHQDVVHLINTLRPANAILSAERRDDRIGETGLDATLLAHELAGIIKNIDTRQTQMFLFIEPDLDQIKTAAKLGVHGVLINVRDLMLDPIELHRQKKFTLVKDAVRLGFKYGMEVHLGGGISAARIEELADIPGIAGLHVGHQLVARSLQLGVTESVKTYLGLIG